jgi:hypothetical protein
VRHVTCTHPPQPLQEGRRVPERMHGWRPNPAALPVVQPSPILWQRYSRIEASPLGAFSLRGSGFDPQLSRQVQGQRCWVLWQCHEQSQRCQSTGPVPLFKTAAGRSRGRPPSFSRPSTSTPANVGFIIEACQTVSGGAAQRVPCRAKRKSKRRSTCKSTR